MGQIGMTIVNGAGDIGAAMINRLHWRRNDNLAIGLADVQTAYNAAADLWLGVQNKLPTGITWTVSPTATIFDEASAVLIAYETIGTLVPPIGGGGATTHAAGIGARCNLRTTTVGNRRLMRGAVFCVPLGSDQFTNSGQIVGAMQTTLQNAVGSWLAALAGGNLSGVVYHRPLKGQTVGGKAASITSHDVPLAPAGLRSRRS